MPVLGISIPGCASLETEVARSTGRERLFFTSQGKTGMINADGKDLRYLQFDRPNQVTWQPGPFLSDGRKVILLSMEERRDGPGRPFSEYYHKTPTHLWIHDLDSGDLVEIATRDRRAVFYTPALMVSDQRMLVQVVTDQGGQILNMNLDGSDAREFTRLGEGLPYGFSAHPGGQRVAYHLASPAGYQIWTSQADGSGRVRVAAHPDRLYFGPAWSPDGEWLAFQSCEFKTDPGHDWSDVCVSRPDGSDFRQLTTGQSMWFGATYGNWERRGGGSNMVSWTASGEILFPRRSPGSTVPWEYQNSRADTDHFNREFRPEASRGGVHIRRLDPRNMELVDLTPETSGVWDFRVSESPEGKTLVICRVETGGMPSIWSMTRDGGGARLLTAGIEGRGADHPRWIPARRR